MQNQVMAASNMLASTWKGNSNANMAARGSLPKSHWKLFHDRSEDGPDDWSLARRARQCMAVHGIVQRKAHEDSQSDSAEAHSSNGLGTLAPLQCLARAQNTRGSSSDDRTPRLSISSQHSEVNLLHPDGVLGHTKPSMVLLQVLALSGEIVFGPEQVVSAMTVRRIVELFDPPQPESEALLLHGDVPLYDTEQDLASLLDDGGIDEEASLDLNMVWRRGLQKGDDVIVHAEISKTLRPGQRGRVCKILREDTKRAIGAIGKWQNSPTKTKIKIDGRFGDGDALISLLNGGNVWVHKSDLLKLHMDNEHFQSP